jgi:hypothetical protein
VEETLLLCRPKDAALLDPRLSYKVRQVSDTRFEVELSCENPAFFVVLDAGSVRGRFCDDCFTLCGTRTVAFDCDEAVTLSEFESALKVYDLYSWCRY